MQTAERPQHRSEDPSHVEMALLRIVDGGLIGILFVAPYLLGGRHTMGAEGPAPVRKPGTGER